MQPKLVDNFYSKDHRKDITSLSERLEWDPVSQYLKLAIKDMIPAVAAFPNPTLLL